MSSKGFVYNANGQYESIRSKRNNKLIEHLAVEIGNVTSTKDTTIVKEATDIQENIDKSAVIKGMTALLSSVINDVASENSADLNKIITLNTTMNISDIDAAGDFSLEDITQSTKLDSTEVNDVTQKISTKVQNDISQKLKSAVTNMVESAKSIQDKNESIANDSTNLGSAMENIAGTVGDTVSDVLSASIGNSTRTETTNISDKKLNKKLKLDESFTLEKDEKVGSDIKNALDGKNLAKAAQETDNNTAFNVKNVKVGGNFKIKNLQQLTSIKQVLNQTFNQSVLQEISNKLIQDYDQNVNNMIKSSEKQAKETSSTATSGDIYACGVAGKQVLEGAGTLAVGVGEGISTAAEGVGTGVATAAKGVGEGIATAAKGMAVVWIALAVVLIVGGLVFAYLQMNDKGPKLR